MAIALETHCEITQLIWLDVHVQIKRLQFSALHLKLRPQLQPTILREYVNRGVSRSGRTTVKLYIMNCFLCVLT